MESEERTEARLSRRRDCDKECCDIESTEQREVQFLSGIELNMPLNLLSATEGVAAARRASEVVCNGDRGWHLRLQKTETLMQRLRCVCIA